MTIPEMLTLDSKTVYDAIADHMRTAKVPGIQTPRRYALRHEVAALCPTVPQADQHVNLLIRAGVLIHVYERDGLRLYLTDKGLTIHDGRVLVCRTTPTTLD